VIVACANSVTSKIADAIRCLWYRAIVNTCGRDVQFYETTFMSNRFYYFFFLSPKHGSNVPRGSLISRWLVSHGRSRGGQPVDRDTLSRFLQFFNFFQ
jgi:hypothetical protein